MRTNRVQRRAVPWSFLWGLAGIVGVIVAGSIGPGPTRAKADGEAWTVAAAPSGNQTPGVTSRSCVSCHHFEQVLTHPTNVRASMPVPASLPLNAGMVTCLTCHDAGPNHATGHQKVGVRSDSSGTSLCMQCHSNVKNSTKAVHALRGGKAHLSARSQYDAHASKVADGESVSCMGCHDGTSASDAGSHSIKRSQDDMLPDHPIGIPMRETGRKRDGDFRLNRTIDKRIRLYDGNLGCGSCHSIYSREPKELVMNNRGSKLCLGCHAQ